MLLIQLRLQNLAATHFRLISAKSSMRWNHKHKMAKMTQLMLSVMNLALTTDRIRFLQALTRTFSTAQTPTENCSLAAYSTRNRAVQAALIKDCTLK